MHEGFLDLTYTNTASKKVYYNFNIRESSCNSGLIFVTFFLFFCVCGRLNNLSHVSDKIICET
jgi:hypothetical protein